MNRIGPDVDQITAITTGDGGLTLHARPPGPAGLTTIRVAGGAVELAVDVAEPDNLVSLTAADLTEPATRRLLRVLLDPPALRALEAVDLRRADELVVWDRSTDPDDRQWGTARGGLGSIGQLATLSGELTRIERTEFGTAVGLLELADLTFLLAADIAPIPGERALLEAAVRQLADVPEDRWARDLGLNELIPLQMKLEQWNDFEEPSPIAAELLGRMIEVLYERTEPPFEIAAIAAPLQNRMADAMAPMPAAAGARRMEVRLPAPFDVIVRPDADGISVATAAIDDCHLAIEGTGNADHPLWVRTFEPGPSPVLVAMAPVQTRAIGQWRARAILPAADTADVLVDVTSHPERPWTSRPTDQVEAAIALGAQAAHETRAERPEARTTWHRAADAWDRAGDPDRAEQARGLATADPQQPTGRRRAPAAIDLVN